MPDPIDLEKLTDQQIRDALKRIDPYFLDWWNALGTPTGGQFEKTLRFLARYRIALEKIRERCRRLYTSVNDIAIIDGIVGKAMEEE